MVFPTVDDNIQFGVVADTSKAKVTGTNNCNAWFISRQRTAMAGVIGARKRFCESSRNLRYSAATM